MSPHTAERPAPLPGRAAAAYNHPGSQRRLLLPLAVCALLGAAWVCLPHPALIVLAALLPLAAIGVLGYPVLVGLAFVCFSFFRLHEVYPFLYPLKIPLLLSLATLVTLAWNNQVTQRIRPFAGPELKAFALFFALVSVGTLFASNRPEAFDYWQSIFVKIGIMTPVLAWLLRSPGHFRQAVYIITAAGLAVGAAALSNKVNGIGLVEGSRVTIGRDLGSVLGDPNDLALVLLFPFSFAAALVCTPRLGRMPRALGVCAALVLLCAVVATQSRGGLLGIVSVMAVFGYRRVRSRVLFFGGGLAAVLLLYLAADIGERASGGAAEQGIDESAMGRLHAWDAAFGMALDNPLSGVGLNNFYFNYYYYSDYWDGLNHAVHSTWFGVLAETGFVGLAAFVAMIAIALRSARNTMRRLRCAGAAPAAIVPAIAEGNLAGLVAFCVSGTFLTQGFTWPLYILLALTMAVAHYVERQDAA